MVAQRAERLVDSKADSKAVQLVDLMVPQMVEMWVAWTADWMDYSMAV